MIRLPSLVAFLILCSSIGQAFTIRGDQGSRPLPLTVTVKDGQLIKASYLHLPLDGGDSALILHVRMTHRDGTSRLFVTTVPLHGSEVIGGPEGWVAETGDRVDIHSLGYEDIHIRNL